MGKWLLIFIVSVFFGCWFFLFKLNGEQENEYENRTSGTGFFEKENEEKIFDKCNVFPNEGFLKTESGYYFDLFKFIKFIEKEQPNFEKDTRNKPYENLNNYFGFSLNKNGECVIKEFTKAFSWDNKNKKIISVKEQFQNFELQDGGALGRPRSPGKTIPHKNPLIISIDPSQNSGQTIPLKII